jgi:uncharacterized membrane protein affecting hemolysin expression
MPEKDFYLIIILSVAIGLLLIRTFMARVARCRKSRRLKREIAEYLALKSSGKRITKTRFGSDS